MSAAEATHTPATDNSFKRRKVRKGTQSCWECKRRKIRCTFAASTAILCDGCKSRGTKCIGQELDDDANSGMLKRTAERRRGRLARGHSKSKIKTTTTLPIANVDTQLTSNSEDLSQILLAAWPSQHDFDLISSVPVGVSVLYHGLVCLPYYTFFGQLASLSPRQMLQRPPKSSHPVVIARRLLLLATLLQSIQPLNHDKLSALSTDCRTIMTTLFNTSTRLVTSNDELVSGSLEGIECVMIESMYLNNAGNLRRAWLANRKAMSMAQMMGLHLGSNSSPSYMLLEEETRRRIDPGYMWFRMVQSDRYLSLMLGLPQGSSENLFASQEAPENCMALERMERMMTAAAGHLLQQSAAQKIDIVETYKVDKKLREAAALMPPEWWLDTPDIGATGIAGSKAKSFEESIRFTNQFAYHHLLVQLHFPFMILQSSAEYKYDYSKMAAANASRTILSQFSSFRNSVSGTAYCRGIDFVTFVASTTLCLSHIEARRRHKGDGSNDIGETVTAFQSLQHQRLSDRALLDRTLNTMKTMARGSEDIIAEKISSILGPLLDIEDNSFRGQSYDVSASRDSDKQESEFFGDISEAFHALRVQIPYFGAIQIKHLAEGIHPSLTSPSMETDSQQNSVPVFFSCNVDEPREDSSLPTGEAPETNLFVPGLTANVTDWALQGVDIALFSSLIQGFGDPL